MPYTSLPTVTAGQTITTTWGNLVDTNLDFLANPPACRVTHNTTQSHTNNGNWQAVVFNTESYDTAGMHSTSVNTSRITITDAGLYLVRAAAAFAASVTGLRNLGFRVNGSGTGGPTYAGQSYPGHANDALMSHSDVIKLVAGDYVEVVAFQNSGGNLTIQNYEGHPSFGALWVGLG